jgi:hypothetical protein
MSHPRGREKGFLKIKDPVSTVIDMLTNLLNLQMLQVDHTGF